MSENKALHPEWSTKEINGKMYFWHDGCWNPAGEDEEMKNYKTEDYDKMAEYADLKVEVFNEDGKLDQNKTRSLNAAMSEAVKMGVEYKQKEKEKLDRLAMEENRKSIGGGVIQLPQYTPRGGVYQDPREGITDLYSKASRGDKEAVNILNSMWQKSITGLRKIEREGIKVVGCPGCNKGLTQDEIDEGVCPICGLNLREQKSRGLEI